MLNSVSICPQCAEEIRIRDMSNHVENLVSFLFWIFSFGVIFSISQCPQRLIFCIHDDCALGKNGCVLSDDNEEIAQPEPQLLAHLLDHHLKFECTSSQVKRHFLLIERSRVRNPYPRPWGISIECVDEIETE